MKIQNLMLKVASAASVVFAAIVFFAFSPVLTFAQDDRATIDTSKIPTTADKAEAFVPAGWKIEEQIAGDVNADGKGDVILKLIQDKPATDKDGTMSERGRAMVILISGDGVKYRRGAVTDKLLQCATCGGAFYGVSDAPANVKIEKGVIIVEQDHGSRWVTDTTYRFRYDEQPGMFILIGFDYSSNDRAAGGSSTESTNYLTGKRITNTISKGGRSTAKTTVISKMRYSIEEIDSEKFDADATKRLGLD